MYIATNSLSCFRLVMSVPSIYTRLLFPLPPSLDTIIDHHIGESRRRFSRAIVFFKERTGPERFSFYRQKGEGRVLERRIKESADDTKKKILIVLLFFWMFVLFCLFVF